MKLLMTLLAAAHTAVKPAEPLPAPMPDDNWPEMQRCEDILEHARRVRDLGKTGRYLGLKNMMEFGCPDELKKLEEEERERGEGRLMQG